MFAEMISYLEDVVANAPREGTGKAAEIEGSEPNFASGMISDFDGAENFSPAQRGEIGTALVLAGVCARSEARQIFALSAGHLEQLRARSGIMASKLMVRKSLINASEAVAMATVQALGVDCTLQVAEVVLGVLDDDETPLNSIPERIRCGLKNCKLEV